MATLLIPARWVHCKEIGHAPWKPIITTVERGKCILHSYRHVFWFLYTASWFTSVQQIRKSLETLASLYACGHNNYLLGLDLYARPTLLIGSTLAFFQGYCHIDSRYAECQRQRCAQRCCRYKEMQSAHSPQERHGLVNESGRYLDTPALRRT